MSQMEADLHFQSLLYEMLPTGLPHSLPSLIWCLSDVTVAYFGRKQHFCWVHNDHDHAVDVVCVESKNPYSDLSPPPSVTLEDKDVADRGYGMFLRNIAKRHSYDARFNHTCIDRMAGDIMDAHQARD